MGTWFFSFFAGIAAAFRSYFISRRYGSRSLRVVNGKGGNPRDDFLEGACGALVVYVVVLDSSFG